MAARDVEFDWWESSYELFAEVFDKVFGAHLETKRLYFDLGRGEYVKFDTALWPTAESLHQAREYGPEVLALAERLSGFVALWQLAGYEPLGFLINDGKWSETYLEDTGDEDEEAFVISMEEDIKEWCEDLRRWMLKTLRDEYEYLLNLPEEEEDEETET